MKKAPLPTNESQRLKSLLSCGILETGAESNFDNLTVLASDLFEVPTCLVGFVDAEHEWVKSKVGWDLKNIPRELSFCSYVISSKETFVVNDLKIDTNFSDHPYVTGKMGLRFYAGAPILSPDGYVLGALSIIDTKPRAFTKIQQVLLQRLAYQASELIALTKTNNQLNKVIKQNRMMESVTSAGGWSLDAKTEELYWSDGVYHIHKIPVGTPTSKIEAINFYAEHERARISQCVDDCMKLYKPYDEEFEFIDAEGGHRWVRTQGEPVLGPRGELLGIAGAFQDITKMKRREVALQRLTNVLKESNNRLRLALDTVEMGVWDHSIKNNTVIWDEGMFKIFGEPPNNNMSGTLIWQKSMHPDDIDRIEEEVALCLKNSRSDLRTHGRLMRPGGEWRYTKILGQVIYDQKGSPDRIVGVTWDVTDEHLRNEELQKQRKMAQHNAKLAAIGELAAGVAHEINNPLTIITGFINLMAKNLEKDSWDRKKMQEAVRKIDISTERIAKIVHGLKNFSRVDKDVVSHFDLVETIDETVAMLLGIYHKEGVDIIFDYDKASTVMIQGNRGKIQQVLINLISNAKDATAGQEVRRVEIQLQKQSGIIQMVVHDNGPGIPIDLRDRVFEPFFTTKDVNKGTGIGLSLVHSIVAEHQGNIRIDEKVKSGASFVVELPESRIRVAA